MIVLLENINLILRHANLTNKYSQPYCNSLPITLALCLLLLSTIILKLMLHNRPWPYK